MATILDLFPARVRFVDEDGRLTGEAVRAMQKLFERVGGATGASTSDLAQSDDEDSGLEEFKHEALKDLDGLDMRPFPVSQDFTDPLHPIPQEHPVLQQLQTELAGLREQVAALMQQINDLQQGPSDASL